MPGRVTATPAAVELLDRLRERHGPLVVHLSGGCCDGSSPMCLRMADLPPGLHDVTLGTLEGAPVVIDAEQDRRWGRPAFRLDVARGPAQGFSLDALEDIHLVAGAGNER